MRQSIEQKSSFYRIPAILGIAGVILLAIQSIAWAAVTDRPYKVIKTYLTNEYGITFPGGMAYLPDSAGFLVWNSRPATAAAQMIGNEWHTSQPADLPASPGQKNLAVFVPTSGQLLWLEGSRIRSFGPQETIGGLALSPLDDLTVDSPVLAQIDPAGMSLDPLSGQLYLLDRNQPRIVVLDSLRGSPETANITEITLPAGLRGGLGAPQLTGLAYNPQTGSLFTMDVSRRTVYELSLDGALLSRMELDVPYLNQVQTLTFAPSTDPTDDPLEQNLFVLDGGTPDASPEQQIYGRVIEISLSPTALPPGTVLQPSYLIRTFETNASLWFANSPDPSGIDYVPWTGELIISDSEVDEFIPTEQKPNVFFTTTAGLLVSAQNTYGSNGSRETAGVTVNPINQHIFFSDDDNLRVLEISPGLDGILWTADDVKERKDVGTDAEDVSYGINKLFIAGGTHNEIVSFDLGADGVLNTADDDPLTAFDTGAVGFSDVEGVTYNEDTGTLFVISTAPADRYLGEFSLAGELLNAWDLSFMGPAGNIRSGLTFAPASQNPMETHLYIVSRGLDNDAYPTEDDGRIWEISLTAPLTPTSTDTATATASATVTHTATTTFTPTITATDTVTATDTATPTVTETSTATATHTVTATATDTATATATDTATATVTDTATATATDTATATATHTATNIITPTFTATFTPTFTATVTPTFTVTFTPTFTATYTATNTATSTATSTATHTATASATVTPSATATSTSPPAYFIYLPLILR